MEEGNLLKADDRFCVHQHCSCLHASAIKYNLETTINVYSVNESSFSMREQPVLLCPVETEQFSSQKYSSSPFFNKTAISIHANLLLFAVTVCHIQARNGILLQFQGVFAKFNSTTGALVVTSFWKK
ncbi:hypothetical protein X798_02668 [Onchocerca flexuosa]|uniref:Uncharacterized protein n=1 Tax=Onchocerca flexuosa TaxID=387005 RepID=A0A238BYN4_9BILA|nr:hypothetical protein X798_02668 [Onchocerca flexuosa]